MDTKLKSSRKLTVILIIMSVMIPAFFMMNQYWNWYTISEAEVENEGHSIVVSEDFLRTFLDAGYILYNLEPGGSKDQEEVKRVLKENSGKMTAYERIYPFLDYRVKDKNGKDVAKSTADSEATSKRRVSGRQSSWRNRGTGRISME